MAIAFSMKIRHGDYVMATTYTSANKTNSFNPLLWWLLTLLIHSNSKRVRINRAENVYQLDYVYKGC
jgi:hypothetical protein